MNNELLAHNSLKKNQKILKYDIFTHDSFYPDFNQVSLKLKIIQDHSTSLI